MNIGFFSKYIKSIFSGSQRTVLLKKNIVASGLLRVVNILTGLLLVPLTINYVNPTQYGIWLTLSSIVGWIAYFDFGLALGFKNRFAEALAVDDKHLAKEYVSTTYALMSIIFIPIGLICLIANRFIDWPSFINVDSSYFYELRKVFDVLIVCFCANQIVKIVCIMLDADQKPAISALINTLAQVIKLFIIYLMTLFIKGSLFNLSVAFSVIPIIVIIVASIIIFGNFRYKQYIPTIKTIKLKLTKNILSLGGQFFIIMISMLFIFQMINIIISRVLGPDVVTQYNIAYKYFSVILMFSSIIVSPLWAAFTDAYTKNDSVWMKKVLKRMETMCLISIPIYIIMFLLAPFVYKIWIGDSVQMHSIESLAVLMYVASNMMGSVYMYMINGTGKVFLQTVVYVIAAIVSIPAMNYACKSYGIVGVLLIPSITFIVLSVLARIQVVKLLKNNASGIWNK